MKSQSSEPSVHRRSDTPIGTIDIEIEVIPLIRRILDSVEEIRSSLEGSRKNLLTIEEVAKATGRAAYTVRTWIREGRIKAIRVVGTGPKGRLLVPRDQLEKLVATGRAGEVPASLLG